MEKGLAFVVTGAAIRMCAHSFDRWWSSLPLSCHAPFGVTVPFSGDRRAVFCCPPHMEREAEEVQEEALSGRMYL